MGEIFKDQEELQQFLHNLGIEYRFSCYEEKNPEGKLVILFLFCFVLFVLSTFSWLFSH